MQSKPNVLAFVVLTGLLLAAFGAQAEEKAAKEPEETKQVQVFVIADEGGKKSIQVEVDDEEVSIVDADGKRRKIVRKKLRTSKRGFLGVFLTGLTPELRKHFGAPANEGVLVAKLVPKAPAEKAGVQVGDVIVAINDLKMDSAWSIGEAIGPKNDGEKIRLTVVRKGKRLTLPVTIESKKRPVVDLSPCIKKGPKGIRFNPDACGSEIEREVEQALKDAGLDEKIQKLEMLELKHFDKREKEIEQRLEEKMKKLEEKLKKLEKKLQSGIQAPDPKNRAG